VSELAEPTTSTPWRPGPEDRAQPAGRVFALVLSELLEDFRFHEQQVRADDVEALHQHRVALRRARSLLAAGRRVFPPEELELLRALGAEYAAATSPVRDLDVLLDGLDARLARVPARLRDAGPELRAAIEACRDHHRAGLGSVMDGELHLTLVRRWQALGSVYRVGGSEPGPDARRPAGEVVDELLVGELRRVRRAGRRASSSDDPEHWHLLRKRLKRLRYVLAAVAPLYPEGAFDGFARRLRRLQDGLGELQDHASHATWFERIGAAAGGRAGLCAGALVVVIEQDTAATLQRCRAAWARFDRPKLRRSFLAAVEQGAATTGPADPLATQD
jgi:CHAD domain-containing protein